MGDAGKFVSKKNCFTTNSDWFMLLLGHPAVFMYIESLDGMKEV